MIKVLEPIAAFELVMLMEHTDVNYSLQTINSFINAGHYTATGFYENDFLVGALVTTESMDSIDIMQIVVHPKHRQKKIATQLLSDFIDNAEKAIMLEVNENNQNAISLYEKLGFKTLNKRLNYYGEKQHALIMRKD